MEVISLTKRNAHCATMIRRKDSPESTPVPFLYRARREGMIGSFFHYVENLEDENLLPTSKFDEWEIVATKHPAYLDEYWELAVRAFVGTSFNSEDRGESAIASHEEELHTDLQYMPEDHKSRYIESYKRYFSDMLSAHSRCANAMITGPAGFNSRKYNKADSAYNNKYKDFREWRKRALKSIEKHRDSQKSNEERNEELWQAVMEDIDCTATTIVRIDKGVERGYNRSLFISNLIGRIATHAGNGNVEIVDRAIALVRQWNAKVKKPVITERHKFFTLPDVARKAREKMGETANRENKEVRVNGVTVIWNYQEDRLQLIFDEKPDKEARELLHGTYRFNWSSRNMAWQRKLTINAVYAATKFLKVEKL